MELANLDMDVLRTLAVAMDVGGFGKAAERLGRSQSAVSLQMRRLEERVGRPLFRREGRGLALTDAGDVVLGYARQILELNDQAVAAARGIAIGGSVRFGVPQDFGDSWLPGVLARFSRAHPSVLIEVRVDRANKLVERIAEGGLDLALMWGSPSIANTVTVQRLPMVWIGLKGYAVPRGNPVPLALFESPCVFRNPGLEADYGRRPPPALALRCAHRSVCQRRSRSWANPAFCQNCRRSRYRFTQRNRSRHRLWRGCAKS